MTWIPRRTPTKRAPASHYALAAAFGIGLTNAVAIAVGASNPESFWQAFAIGTLCACFPAFKFGWDIFVSRHTVTMDSHGDEGVEARWMERAGAGAFLDVFVATGLGAAALGVTGLELQANVALLGLGLLMMADVALRYLIIKRRAS